MEDKEKSEKVENEEKVNCCETCVGCKSCNCKGCNGCCSSMHMHGCHGYGCGRGFGRYHVAKKILFIVLLIVAFCFGTAWGEMHSYERNIRFNNDGYGYGMMMNWDGFGNGQALQQRAPSQATGNTTVKVAQ